MPSDVKLKFYKQQSQGKTLYDLLPSFNTPFGYQEVSDPNEINTAISDYSTRVIGGASGAEQKGLQQRLNDFQSDKSEFVLNKEGVLATQKEVAAQQQQAQQLASGQVQNFGTTQAPLTVPLGTPTPQQSNAAFRATQPKPTYQETPGAAQYPGEAIDISKKYQEGAEAAKAAGVTSPSDYTGANTMFNQFLPSQQAPSGIDNFISQDLNIQALIKGYQDQMSSINQRTGLVDTYKAMLKDSGIQEIDLQLVDMRKILDGTTDDIRMEIQKSGTGIANESQIAALSAARSKVLLKNYNFLLDLRNSKSQYLDILMNLTQKDRQEADQRFETQMNFGMKIAEMGQKMKQNAIENLDRVAKTIGWDGIYENTQGDPYAIRNIEFTYGLPAGSLIQAAFRDREARMIESQNRASQEEQQQFERQLALGKFGESQRQFEIESQLAQKKFAEDKRQFGLNYALKQEELKKKKEADKTKPLTVDQAKAYQFGVAAENANNILRKGYLPRMPFQEKLPNSLKSSEQQNFEQAARAFVNATLRRESGATITDSEFLNKYKELIPSFGDKQSVLSQKEAARNAAVASIKVAANQPNGGIITQSDGTAWQDNGDDTYTRIK